MHSKFSYEIPCIYQLTTRWPPTLIRDFLRYENGAHDFSNDYKVSKKKGSHSRGGVEGFLTCNDFQVKLLGQCLD